MSRKPILSKRNKVKIINKILAGEPYYRISKEFNICNSSVALIGQRMGIRRLTNESKRKWTASAIDQYLLESGATIRRVSSNFRHIKTPIEWRCSLCGEHWGQSFDTVKRRIENNLSKTP